MLYEKGIVMRTIVIADVHGQLNLLENVLKHSKYNQDKDKIIFAGDFCDIGDQTIEVQEWLECANAEIILGNHEIAHMFGHSIRPYDYRIDSEPGLVQEWRNKTLSGIWKLATAIETPSGDDILITHGGVSTLLEEKLMLRGLTAKQAADKINTRFLEDIRLEHDTKLLGPRNHWLIYNELLSPVWYRPYTEWWCEGEPEDIMPCSYRQIAGHTPRECYTKEQLEYLDKIEFILIDPYQGGRMNIPGYCLYAVVENNEVNIIESTNPRDCNKES